MVNGKTPPWLSLLVNFKGALTPPRGGNTMQAAGRFRTRALGRANQHKRPAPVVFTL
jgi:hypothetical protein